MWLTICNDLEPVNSACRGAGARSRPQGVGDAPRDARHQTSGACWRPFGSRRTLDLHGRRRVPSGVTRCSACCSSQ